MKKSKKFTQKECLEKFKEAHGERFDYSKVVYVKAKEKVIIICSIHGEFLKTPQLHWSGKNCPKCTVDATKGKTPEKYTVNSYFTKVNKIHNSYYDYSKSIFVKSSTKMTITCPQHGDFEMTATRHTTHGCIECALLKKQEDGREEFTREFIESCKSIHNNRYSYNEVSLVKIGDEITVECSEHGKFTLSGGQHKSGMKCPDCKIPGDSLVEILDKFKITHGDRYDYSKVHHAFSKENVTIICRDHGEFQQMVGNHRRGHGCPICKLKLMGADKKISPDTFFTKVNEIHNFKYDYSETKFVDASTKLTINCLRHGKFAKFPMNHYKTGCPKCAKLIRAVLQRKLCTQKFILESTELFDDRFDYSKTDILHLSEYPIIICPDHGEFTTRADKHKDSIFGGCKECKLEAARVPRFSLDEIITKFKNKHGDRFDYSKVEQAKSHENVTIICKIHGEFQQAIQNHTRNGGCSKCTVRKRSTKYKPMTYYDEKFFRQFPEKREQSCSLYLLSFSNKNRTFIKVGITIHTIKKRFSGKEYQYDIVELLLIHTTLELAYIMEQIILYQFKNYKYDIGNIKFGGFTELFDHNHESEIKTFMIDLYESALDSVKSINKKTEP